MSVTITRPTTTDDDGTRTTGTIFNHAFWEAFCDSIDTSFALLASAPVVGTWTPVIGGSGGTSGQAYTSQSGHYIKIGKLVMASCYVVLSTKGTITGTVQIQGLPFTSDSTAGFYASGNIPFFTAMATNWTTIGGYIAPGTSVLEVTGIKTAAGSVVTMATADLNNTSGFMMSVAYRASA